jgi:N-acetylglutamate synthase-like GNAT family acetyltransferase
MADVVRVLWEVWNKMEHSQDSMTIRPFAPGYEDRIVGLILPIQREEFGIPITAEEQPDLRAIPAFYQEGSGNFWLALDGEQVIGTIALLDIGNRQAALRKMFVHRDYRGKQAGVAKRLLDTLIAGARQQHIAEIYLGTTAKYLAAHRFYEKHGFIEITRDMLPPAFPIMAVDTKFYTLKL